MIISVLLLVVAFLVISFSTNIAIDSFHKLSIHSRISTFTLSLFVIGAVTSFPEVAITVNSLILNSPQVALGNLIGSQLFLLFVVIPVAAIVSKGLQLQTQLKNLSLALTVLVAFVPIVALYNQTLEISEVFTILGVYFLFVIAFSQFAQRNSWLERIIEKIRPNQPKKISSTWEIFKIIGSVSILLLACNTTVRQIIELAAYFQTPRFLLSMIILPIGTNLPEICLALGFAAEKKDLAFGDYMGSIAFNSLLIAILALGVGGSISVGQNINLVVIAFVAGLAIFGLACFSRKWLSVKEGLLLLTVYLILLGLAIWQIMSGISR